MHRPVVWGARNFATEKHEEGAKIHIAALGRYFVTKRAPLLFAFFKCIKHKAHFIGIGMFNVNQ